MAEDVGAAGSDGTGLPDGGLTGSDPIRDFLDACPDWWLLLGDTQHAPVALFQAQRLVIVDGTLPAETRGVHLARAAAAIKGEPGGEDVRPGAAARCALSPGGTRETTGSARAAG